MRENCTSGLMSGERKRSALERAPPRLSSTLLKRQKNDATDAEAICEAVTRADAATRHDHMDVRMMGHGRAPGNSLQF